MFCFVATRFEIGPFDLLPTNEKEIIMPAMDALDIPWEDIFKPGASIAFSKFNKWVQVVFGVYIPHIQYLVKPHSSPWTSTSTTNRYNSQYE